MVKSWYLFFAPGLPWHFGASSVTCYLPQKLKEAPRISLSVQVLALQDSMALQEGEPHCSPVSEDTMLQISAIRADAAQETGDADNTDTDKSANSSSKAATDDNTGMGPSRYSVCDGQRINNRSLQLSTCPRPWHYLQCAGLCSTIVLISTSHEAHWHVIKYLHTIF